MLGTYLVLSLLILGMTIGKYGLIETKEVLNINRLLVSAKKMLVQGINDYNEPECIPGCLGMAHNSTKIIFKEGAISDKNYLIKLLENKKYKPVHFSILELFNKN